MAGALGFAIAGPRPYSGQLVQDAWMGNGRAELGSEDLRRALALYVLANLLLAVMVAAFAFGGVAR